ncbi:MAG: hypothetical protein ACJ8G3_17920, partial [Burkholderiaceae bacterium]
EMPGCGGDDGWQGLPNGPRPTIWRAGLACRSPVISNQLGKIHASRISAFNPTTKEVSRKCSIKKLAYKSLFLGSQ